MHIVLLLLACDGGKLPDAPDTADTAPSATGQDILTTHLALDVGAREGVATLAVVPAAGAESVRLEVWGLDVRTVALDGADLAPVIEEGMLVVPVAPSATPNAVEVAVGYAFRARTLAQFDGWMPAQGVSFVWPYFCGNLFPCDSSMRDGVSFTMDVTGTDPALVAVYPQSTGSDAPAYMPALAVGPYTRIDLGTTVGGTALHAWHFPGRERAARAGTEHLVDVFGYYETVYGPYAFGSDAGAVEVDWGDDSFGGMEHHPYWHVGTYDMNDEEVQCHEAAHAWYGDGVRFACWEDFVLSEGTTTYITARALEQVGGPDVWTYYVDDFLVPLCEGDDVNAVALPDDTCNAIDLLSEDLWSFVPYMKGACFYEDVADLVGAEQVDGVIADFYATHVNGTARMQDMIDLLVARAGPEHRDAIERYAAEWLRSLECPAGYAERCRSRMNAL